jgi:hypothetical protein
MLTSPFQGIRDMKKRSEMFQIWSDPELLSLARRVQKNPRSWPLCGDWFHMLAQASLHLLHTKRQCCGSMTSWCGSGSDPRIHGSD